MSVLCVSDYSFIAPPGLYVHGHGVLSAACPVTWSMFTLIWFKVNNYFILRKIASTI